MCNTIGGLKGVICNINEVLSYLLPVLITLGVVYFIWGVVTYVIGGDEEAKTAGRDKIIYGIIGLAVIIGVWGLVNIVNRTFGLNQYNAPTSTNLRDLLPR